MKLEKAWAVRGIVRTRCFYTFLIAALCFLGQLRTVPLFATADKFCGTHIAQFRTMWEKQILARVVGIQDENYG